MSRELQTSRLGLVSKF